jgi:tRNA(fMet)-specific endonuclease VapC
MKYLLDTCVVSDFVRGDPSTLERIKKSSPIDIAVSSITVMELHYGIALNPTRVKLIKPVILDFLNVVHLLDFNQADAECAAMIRAFLKKKGKPIGSYDLLLAGIALNRELVLVSSNVTEFMQVKGLLLENWRMHAT